MTLGDYDYGMLGSTPYPKMAKVVFVIFQVDHLALHLEPTLSLPQILIPILLLNMLIAMMGNTYGIVIESAEKEFLKAWAKVRCQDFLDDHDQDCGHNHNQDSLSHHNSAN